MFKGTKSILLVISAILFSLSLAACSSQPDSSDITTVIKVVDGDTLKVKVDGVEETVRLLCVDTPEMKDDRWNGPQPFAEEAKQLAEQMLMGQEVTLEKGLGEGRDKYGRLLAYVYIDGKMFNEILLSEGLARVAYVYSPNTKYVDQFRAIQEEAITEEKGIWSIENYAREDGFHLQAATNKRTSNIVQQDCTIKGNINSKGEKIYHLPGGAYYDQTQPEMMFCSEEAAQKAGFRAASK